MAVSALAGESLQSQTEEVSDETDDVMSDSMPAAAPVAESFEKRTKIRTRTIWTLILISSFFSIIAAGHFYCSLLVLALIGGMFYEITKLKRDREKEHKLPFFFAATTAMAST